jgi:hypothetical protein
MTNTDQLHELLIEDETPGTIAARWRRIGQHLSILAEITAHRVATNARGAVGDDAKRTRAHAAQEAADIRSIASVVIAAQRTMENENHYRPRDGAVVDVRALRSAEIRNLEDYERGVRERLAAEPGRQQGDAPSC